LLSASLSFSDGLAKRSIGYGIGPSMIHIVLIDLPNQKDKAGNVRPAMKSLPLIWILLVSLPIPGKRQDQINHKRTFDVTESIIGL